MFEPDRVVERVTGAPDLAELDARRRCRFVHGREELVGASPGSNTTTARASRRARRARPPTSSAGRTTRNAFGTSVWRCANDGGSTTTRSKRCSRRRRRSISTNASPVDVCTVHARTAAMNRLWARLRSAVRSAGPLTSTRSTLVAPPAAAATEKPPVLANTSSTRAPLRHRPHQRPVVALVEEVPGLVAADDVGLEGEAPLAEPDRARRVAARRSSMPSVSPNVSPLPTVRERRSTTRSGSSASHSVGDHGGEVGEPDRGVQLDDQRAVVAVDHQRRQAVVLAVHAAVGVGVGIGGERRAALEGGRDPLPPERLVDRTRFAVVQDLEADRRSRDPTARSPRSRRLASNTTARSPGARRRRPT